VTATTPAPAQPAYAPAIPPRHRPIGVTLLAILEIIIGLLVLISAIGVLALAGYLSSFTVPQEVQQTIPQWVINAAPMALALAGVVLFAIAIVSFLIAWGFLKGRNWARTFAIVLLFLSILASIFNAIVTAIFTTDTLFGILLSIIIPVLLIWYLTTRRVKAWFIPGYYTKSPR
jgi:hypothetical protein